MYTLFHLIHPKRVLPLCPVVTQVMPPKLHGRDVTDTELKPHSTVGPKAEPVVT